MMDDIPQASASSSSSSAIPTPLYRGLRKNPPKGQTLFRGGYHVVRPGASESDLIVNSRNGKEVVGGVSQQKPRGLSLFSLLKSLKCTLNPQYWYYYVGSTSSIFTAHSLFQILQDPRSSTHYLLSSSQDMLRTEFDQALEKVEAQFQVADAVGGAGEFKENIDDNFPPPGRTIYVRALLSYLEAIQEDLDLTESEAYTVYCLAELYQSQCINDVAANNNHFKYQLTFHECCVVTKALSWYSRTVCLDEANGLFDDPDGAICLHEECQEIWKVALFTIIDADKFKKVVFPGKSFTFSMFSDVLDGTEIILDERHVRYAPKMRFLQTFNSLLDFLQWLHDAVTSPFPESVSSSTTVATTEESWNPSKHPSPDPSPEPPLV